MALSVFQWKNLPDTIDERFLELTLTTQGSALFFEDDVLGYLALRSANAGQFNVYNIPMNRTAYGSNGYQKELDNTNSVIIYNNYLRQNMLPAIELYAQKLYEVDRARDVNIHGQKTPFLILCDESQRLTLENLYMKYDGNEPVIFGSKLLANTDFKVLPTNVPFVADALSAQLSQIWNEALTYFGVPNISIAKKERVVTDEILRSQGGTVAARYSRLQARAQACEEINKMFGLNIQCDFRDFGIEDSGESTNENDKEVNPGE